MKAVTAKRLREWLAKVPDEAVFLMPASDHSYRPVTFNKTTAIFTEDGEISEDFGEFSTPDTLGGRRNVVVIQ